MALFLERVATPPDTYQYQLLATTQTSTMQEELDEAAARGFRMLARTLIPKDRPFGGRVVRSYTERQQPRLGHV